MIIFYQIVSVLLAFLMLVFGLMVVSSHYIRAKAGWCWTIITVIAVAVLVNGLFVNVLRADSSVGNGLQVRMSMLTLIACAMWAHKKVSKQNYFQ